MDDDKQFEIMAALRAYASKIVNMPAHDVRPSTASGYFTTIQRMSELSKQLDRRS